MGQVQADGALAPVGLFDHEVDAARAAGHEAGGDEAPLRVAGYRVLHLDHVGTPVDQHRAAGGDEHPASHLDHPDALERAAGRGGFVAHQTSSKLSIWRMPWLNSSSMPSARR